MQFLPSNYTKPGPSFLPLCTPLSCIWTSVYWVSKGDQSREFKNGYNWAGGTRGAKDGKNRKKNQNGQLIPKLDFLLQKASMTILYIQLHQKQFIFYKVLNFFVSYLCSRIISIISMCCPLFMSYVHIWGFAVT